jgi:hypothetical protein
MGRPKHLELGGMSVGLRKDHVRRDVGEVESFERNEAVIF